MTEFKKECERILGVMELTRDTVINDHADSMARVELVMAAEAIVGFELTNAQILTLQTYGDLEDLVSAKVTA